MKNITDIKCILNSRPYVLLTNLFFVNRPNCYIIVYVLYFLQSISAVIAQTRTSLFSLGCHPWSISLLFMLYVLFSV